jgi:hypothetical protein
VPSPAQADSPPPKPAEAAEKAPAPIETGKTSVKKKAAEIADTSPAPPPKEIERQPAAIVSQAPTTQTVVVRSDRAWTFTGIVLGATDTATITASGAIQVVAEEKHLAHQQPGGFYPNCDRAKELFHLQIAAVPAPSLACWSLIGRVGPRGTIFDVGVQGTVPAGLKGRLFLGVNDDNYADNAGSWSAVVTVEHH